MFLSITESQLIMATNNKKIVKYIAWLGLNLNLQYQSGLVSVVLIGYTQERKCSEDSTKCRTRPTCHDWWDAIDEFLCHCIWFGCICPFGYGLLKTNHVSVPDSFLSLWNMDPNFFPDKIKNLSSIFCF